MSEIKRLHYVYRRQPLPGGFEQAVAALGDRIPGLTDEQVFFEMQRLMVRLGDGHSTLFPVGSRVFSGSPSLMPLRLYAFSDGVYVIEAPPEHASAVGSRVTKIAGKPIDSVLDSIGEFVSRDNPAGVRWLACGLLVRSPLFLRAAGLDVGGAEVALELKSPDGGLSQLNVRPVATPVENLPQSQKKLAPPKDIAQAPLYLKRMREHFWLEKLPEHEALYVQFNQVLDRPDERLSAFAKRLRGALDEGRTRHLIVDVRHNNGGDASLLGPLVRTLIYFEMSRERPKLFVLIGRTTNSAAQIFVNDLAKWTSAIFVGEPTRSRPNFVGEDTHVTLPYSGVRASISSRYHQTDGMDRRIWIAPHVPVPLRAADYFANRDPAMDAVLELIRSDP